MINIYDSKLIGKRIKAERNALKFSQEKLAELMSVARQTIGSWEKGKLGLTVNDLLNLCNIFECDMGYLLCEYDCKTRQATDVHEYTGLSEDIINRLHSKSTMLSLESNPTAHSDDAFEFVKNQTANEMAFIDAMIRYSVSDAIVERINEFKLSVKALNNFNDKQNEALNEIFGMEFPLSQIAVGEKETLMRYDVAGICREFTDKFIEMMTQDM